LIENYQKNNQFDKTSSNKLARYLINDFGVTIKDVKKRDKNGLYVRDGRRYILSYEQLKEVYEKNGWIDELTEVLPDYDDDNDEKDENIDKTDKAEYRAEECIKLEKCVKRLHASQESLKEDLNSALQYIKDLEKYIYDKEDIEENPPIRKENKMPPIIQEPKKRKNKQEEYKVIADGVVINVQTNEIQQIQDELSDEEVQSNVFDF